ncbi:thiamine pyrophosphate-binding protein [Actinosynnema sp. NPDC023658]|uniref:thiamine pyrophosphate-binding protein n=1 Tax=Actinosynnema sp. NPDC023658 TaxID=3155465 RepID=UPI00340F592D
MTTHAEREQRQRVRPADADRKRGRDVILDYLRTAGVDRMFGVPGTNEVPIIDGTDVPTNDVAYVPCLHENIALGAAMGYARATGKPGVVELHVTPGIGHALGNLFNAARSHVPVVVLCGQQHSNLLIQEPLLASDLVRVADQYTKWSYEVRGPDEIGMAMQRALKVAMAPPLGPVFLSIPWQFTVEDSYDPGRGRFTRVASGFAGDVAEVRKAAEVLATARTPLIVVGDGVGAADAWEEIRSLAELLRAPVYSEQLSSYLNYPNQYANWMGELPGTQAKVRDLFAEHDVAFLCGFNAQAQLVVFNWDDGPLIPPDVRQVYLHNDPWQIGKNHFGEAAVLGDIKVTLPSLTRETAARMPDRRDSAAQEWLAGLRDQRQELVEHYARNGATRNGTSPGEVAHNGAGADEEAIEGAEVAAAMAELQRQGEIPGLVLVNEGVSDLPYFAKSLHFDHPTSYFVGEGGSLGYSMPASLGFRLATGTDRTVVNVVGDGSALFYPQSWWTAVRLHLPILYVVLNNGEYKTLLIGVEQIENSYPWQPSGPTRYLHLEPSLDYVELAAGYGVPGQRVQKREDLVPALAKGLAHVRGKQPGAPDAEPYLVEVPTSAALPPTDRTGWFDNVVVVP